MCTSVHAPTSSVHKSACAHGRQATRHLDFDTRSVLRYVEKHMVKFKGRISEFFPELGAGDIAALDEWRGMFEELAGLQSDWRFPWDLHLKIAKKLNKKFKLRKYRSNDKFHKRNALNLQTMCGLWLAAQSLPWARNLDSPTPQPQPTTSSLPAPLAACSPQSSPKDAPLPQQSPALARTPQPPSDGKPTAHQRPALTTAPRMISQRPSLPSFMLRDVACFCGEAEASETELMDVAGQVRAEVAIVDAPASSGTRIIRTMNGEAAEVPANVASELAGEKQHDAPAVTPSDEISEPLIDKSTGEPFRTRGKLDNMTVQYGVWSSEVGPSGMKMADFDGEVVEVPGAMSPSQQVAPQKPGKQPQTQTAAPKPKSPLPTSRTLAAKNAGMDVKKRPAANAGANMTSPPPAKEAKHEARPGSSKCPATSAHADAEAPKHAKTSELETVPQTGNFFVDGHLKLGPLKVERYASQSYIRYRGEDGKLRLLINVSAKQTADHKARSVR